MVEQDHDIFIPPPPKPVGNSLLSHAFDSNAVRVFGPLDEPTWQRFKAGWNAKGYTTAWIPWVAREVAGTNFIRDDGTIVMQSELEEIVRSVRRYHELTKGEVYADFEDMIKFSLFEYVDDSRWPQHVKTDQTDILKRVFLAQRVKDRLDIGKDGSYNDGSYWLGFKDPAGGWFGEQVRHTFVGHSEKAIAAWKKVITVNHKAKDEQIIRDIVRQLQKLVIFHGDKLKVPHDVLQAVLDKWRASGENPDTMFTYASFVESWYYVEFARGNFTRKRYENDGHDIQIASYLSRADHFVTGDKNLRTLLKHFTRESDRKLIKPEDFVEQVIA